MIKVALTLEQSIDECEQALADYWAHNQTCPVCLGTVKRYSCGHCDRTGVVRKPSE
jgi:hypothetical protein